MTKIDSLIWELHKALKGGNENSVKQAQKSLLALGYIVENSYMVSKIDEPGFTHNINIPFMEKRFKNIK